MSRSSKKLRAQPKTETFRRTEGSHLLPRAVFVGKDEESASNSFGNEIKLSSPEMANNWD